MEADLDGGSELRRHVGCREDKGRIGLVCSQIYVLRCLIARQHVIHADTVQRGCCLHTVDCMRDIHEVDDDRSCEQYVQLD